MRSFFNALYGDSEGFVPIVTYPPSAREKVNDLASWKAMPLNRYEWFEWPRQADQLIAYCDSHRKEDVYVTPALFAEKKNIKPNAKSLSVVHCDADTAHPDKFALPPSIVVESSPGRYQLYWKLDKDYKPNKVEPLAKAVTYSQLANGSDTGWALNKLLRVPGTKNTKPSYRKPYVSVEIPGAVYTSKQIKKAFGAVAKPQSTERVMGTIPDKASVWASIPATEHRLIELLTVKGEDWSTRLWEASMRLLDLKFTPEQCFAVLHQCACDKWARDNKSPEMLWRDVLKAESEHEVFDDLAFSNDPRENREISLKVSPADVYTAHLLTDKERLQIKPTILEKYAELLSVKPSDPDPQYQIVNCMILLSTLLSEFAYVYPAFGQGKVIKFNMWFMILGQTSLTRKTTAADPMLAILRHMSAGREYSYRLPERVSPESLNSILGNRGDVSSLFHRDEAHDLINAARGGKSYMSGFTELVTQLYDGRVPARDTLGGTATPEGPTTFNMHLMGVPDEMSRVLSEEDFAKGFLARMIFVLGRSTSQRREDNYVEFGKPGEIVDVPPVLEPLVAELEGARARWQAAYNRAGGPVCMVPTQEAAQRWNDFKEDLKEMAEKSEEPKMVVPTSDRMSKSVLKLACLLAMMDRTVTTKKPEVRLIHVLTAIKYCEGWYDTLLTMTKMVNLSAWGKQVDDVIHYVRGLKGHKAKEEQIYRRFTQYNDMEMDRIFKAGINQGRMIRVVEDNDGRKTIYRQVIE